MRGLAKITIRIENFIKTKIDETDNGVIEIGRNDLANQFGCAPSQINYVLSTRFTPYKGYYIESRRGGGGYIKIMKVSMDDEWFVELLFETIGESITKNKADMIIDGLMEKDLIDKSESIIMKAGLEDRALLSVDPGFRNVLRADILKNFLLVIMR